MTYKPFALPLVLALAACTTPASDSARENDVVLMTGKRGTPQVADEMNVKVLKFDELHTCGMMIQDLEAGRRKANVQSASFDRARLSLEKEENEIELDRNLVDVNQSKQVDAFNNRIAQHRMNVEKFNKNIAAAKKFVSELELNRNKVNLECAQRSYRLSDLEKMDPATKSAIESMSSSSEIPWTGENFNGQH